MVLVQRVRVVLVVQHQLVHLRMALVEVGVRLLQLAVVLLLMEVLVVQVQHLLFLALQ